MSTYVIIHKGFKNVMYENSVVGILLAIFKKQCCEFDILYDQQQWRICHDKTSLTLLHTDFAILLDYLRQHKKHIHNNIIVDVKWDFIHNHQDNMEKAVILLQTLLKGMEDFPFWLQASHPLLLEMFIKYSLATSWKMGLIVSSPWDFHRYKKYFDYAMVSLSDFPQEEIHSMYQEKEIVGYTCTNLQHLSQYRHLFPYLVGIVCDVPLS